MRLRNKELRQRRHRKQDTIREAVRVAKAEAAASKVVKPAPKKKTPAAK